jgi:hypothetical protein
MGQRVYIASYHQSTFGKLLGMTVPEIVANAVGAACREVGTAAAAIDVASVRAGEGPARGRDVQHRRPDLRVGVHRAQASVEGRRLDGCVMIAPSIQGAWR